MAFGLVALSVLDAALTKIALELGCIEMNPLAMQNPIWKANIALVVIIGLCLLKRQQMIPLLCVGMGVVCCWNAGMILTARIIG